MKKTRKLSVKQDFPLSRTNLRNWGDDFCASVLPFFVSKESNQTPVVAVGKTIGKQARHALIRAFRKQRERVTITTTIPRTARCVAADLTVLKSACGTCGQPAKELVSRIAFFADGRPVEFGGVPRKTVAVCPACNSVSDAVVQGPATHVLIEKSGSNEPLFSEIDEL